MRQKGRLSLPCPFGPLDQGTDCQVKNGAGERDRQGPEGVQPGGQSYGQGSYVVQDQSHGGKEHGTVAARERKWDISPPKSTSQKRQMATASVGRVTATVTAISSLK